jgi:hypothetical protein
MARPQCEDQHQRASMCHDRWRGRRGPHRP